LVRTVADPRCGARPFFLFRSRESSYRSRVHSSNCEELRSRR
jgi:hypothetical protein